MKTKNSVLVFVLYLLVLPYAIYLAFKFKSLAFFTYVNPRFHLGGMIGQSKSSIDSFIREEFRPKCISFRAEGVENLKKLMEDNAIDFPIVIKPEYGDRGIGVSKFKDWSGVKNYMDCMEGCALLLEEFIEEKEEYAILFSKYPKSNKQSITSFSMKKSRILYGDGIHNLYQLILIGIEESKFREKYFRKWHKHLGMVLQEGESFELTDLGNCSDGVNIIDMSSHIDQALIDAFERLTRNIEGFDFGRFDVKANSVEALKRGEFKVIELNGVNSMPLHVYAGNISCLNYYRGLMEHWAHIYNIAIERSELGDSGVSCIDTLRDVMKYRRMYRKYA